MCMLAVMKASHEHTGVQPTEWGDHHLFSATTSGGGHSTAVPGHSPSATCGHWPVLGVACPQWPVQGPGPAAARWKHRAAPLLWEHMRFYPALSSACMEQICTPNIPDSVGWWRPFSGKISIMYISLCMWQIILPKANIIGWLFREQAQKTHHQLVPCSVLPWLPRCCRPSLLRNCMSTALAAEPLSWRMTSTLTVPYAASSSPASRLQMPSGKFWATVKKIYVPVAPLVEVFRHWLLWHVYSYSCHV